MRNWDPIDIARRVVAGEVCQLGKWLTVFMHGPLFVSKCKRCSVELLMSRQQAATRLPEIEHFLNRHTHEEVRYRD